MNHLTRRHLLAGAAATAACAAMPAAAAAIGAVGSVPMSVEDWIAANIEWPRATVDRQAFHDGRILWTYYARRREWIGIDWDGVLAQTN